MANPKPGSFVHIEIASTDPARTRKFMEDVFAWRFEDIPDMSYMTYQPASPPGGGIMAPMENQSPGFLNYVLSTDVDTDLRRIEAAGGHVVQPKMEIPGVGWWAGFTEPTGIMLAVFQPKEMPRPPAARRRPAARSGKKARGGRKASRGRRRR